MVGDVEVVDGVLQIRRIHVRYHLTVPAGRRGDAERAVAKHPSQCPVHQTLTPCVAFDIEAEIHEEEDA